ncbi:MULTISPECIES: GAF domain-containing sensor histidine kinase [Pseudonocardia]|uniref:GAF domain protein n=2 Tax=Pseudonocardia TaxID=1847 RepID=A0A1Y2MH60_PSEAH|nr:MULTISPECIES: GAF domain-containing protein [Pseudonocardia]OSY34431.1 GAF domain protein [Pseudonocardia autotrophica]TDN74688.1 histidine kinase [Pseudonocardia autotrophica]BBG05461.1 hypothetical protein Pdca_66700 [Pseudonocardia autotrophica]GEC29730.1 hypothetical protein PSA01_67590 [Pseudonocardia saturnea]
MEYVVDGGGSRAIHDALGPVLEEVRVLLAADMGLVLYRPRRRSDELMALASAAVDPAAAFLANEPVTTSRPLPGRKPRVVVELEVRSAMRELRARFATALVIPWRDASGIGTVLVGQTGGRAPTPWGEDPTARSELGRLVAATVRSGRETGSRQVDRELREAARRVAEAAVEATDVRAAIAAVLDAAHLLVGSEVAYLSLPDGGPDTFAFDQMLGIRTPDFRHVRVHHGQGLGGLARAVQRPVRSANYAEDERLHAAPVTITRGEGIVSAMAAPITVDDHVAGVLYVGDRQMRAFTQVDEDLLAEFTDHAALGLRRRLAENQRADALERRIREDVAYNLHDTVVRGLITIGFRAEQARYAVGTSEVAADLATIAEAAESCLGQLRGEVGSLLSRGDIGGVRASEVLEQILTAPQGRLSRSPELDGEDIELARASAEALVRVGLEAVTNAERHSGGHHVIIRLVPGSLTSRLLVVDDGAGRVETGEGPGGPTTDHPHLGLQAMRAAVERVDGRLAVHKADPLGIEVHAAVPTWPGPGRISS